MDIILECAKNFEKLLDISYECVVSKSRKAQRFVIDFKPTDFYHLAGLQYLTDIDIGRNRSKILTDILNGKVTDKELSKSAMFKRMETSRFDIPSRIRALRYLEDYIDANNYIYIYSLKNEYSTPSLINADYVIKSSSRVSRKEAYIFLRKRQETDNYLVVSFFVKGNERYGGQNLYWLSKTKKTGDEVKVLYRHPQYVAPE